MRFEAKSLRLNRNSAATCERVYNRRELTIVRLADLVPRLLHEAFVIAVLPDDELFHQFMQSCALSVLRFSCRELLRARSWVIDKLGE